MKVFGEELGEALGERRWERLLELQSSSLHAVPRPCSSEFTGPTTSKFRIQKAKLESTQPYGVSWRRHPITLTTRMRPVSFTSVASVPEICDAGDVRVVVGLSWGLTELLG